MASTVNGKSATLSKDDSSIAHRIFERWMAEFDKSYQDEAEKEKRFEVFQENWHFIEDFNSAGNQSYTMGLNPFSDLTFEEFGSMCCGCRGVLPSSFREAAMLNSCEHGIVLTGWPKKLLITQEIKDCVTNS